jgi:REP element-mobilizing transposase RayT
MPPSDPQRHRRRSIRLPGYDYTRAGAYIVTVVTYGRENLFGEIDGGVMGLNRFGEIVSQAWLELPRHYPHAALDTFICMPNHVHGIMMLRDDTGRGGSVPGVIVTPSGAPSGESHLPEDAQTRPYAATRHGLPEIMRAFKSFSARRINILRHTPGIPVWQRNYYEHIIRDEREMDALRQYILNNPQQWELDQENVKD